MYTKNYQVLDDIIHGVLLLLFYLSKNYKIKPPCSIQKVPESSARKLRKRDTKNPTQIKGKFFFESTT